MDSYNSAGYFHLDNWIGHGWPTQRDGNRWLGYWEPGQGTRFVYYGGLYNDWNGVVSNFEQTAHGGTPSNSYSTYRSLGITHNSPYVEYDMDYYNAPRSARNDRRIVRNSITGQTFATFDHYNSFYYLGRF